MKRRDERSGIALLLSLLLALQLCLTPMAVLAEDSSYDDGIRITGYSGTYDGKAHSITVTIPASSGLTVTYAYPADSMDYRNTNPTFINAGTYKVAYRIEKGDEISKEGVETVYIERADVSSEVKSKLSSSFPYTGKAVSFSPFHEGIETWEIGYSNADGALPSAPSAPGSYSVKIVGYGSNHTATIFHAFTILEEELPGETIEYSVRDYNDMYDGMPHSITLNVATPDVTVTYASRENGKYSFRKPMYTNAGTYMVYYRLEKDGFETVEGAEYVQISRVDVSGLVKFNKQGSYACTGSPVDFAPSCEGISSWTYYHYDERGKLLDQAPSAPGSYSVSIYGSGTNYYARTSHAYRIVEAQEIEYTVSGYTGACDGAAHTIDLRVTTEGVSVTFATSEGGAYTADKPSFTDAGEYTVWFRLEKEGYRTVVDSATVTILELRKIEYSVEDSYVYYDGEAHTIALNVLTEGVTVTYAEKEDVTYKQDVSYNPDNTSAPTGDSTVQSYDFTMPTGGVTVNSSFAPTDSPTAAPTDAATDGAGVYVDSSGFTMDGGTIDTATTGNGNSSLIGNTGNGIGGGSSGEGSNIQISGGSVKDNAGTSAPRPNDPAGDPTGTQVYKTEVGFDGNNSSGANPNGSTNQIPGCLSLDDPDNSNEEQLLVQRGDLTVVPTGSFSSQIEFIPCELNKSGVVIRNTSLSPFLLIYGPKEAFSKLLTVRAKDGVFTWDGEGHAVAAEPSIAEGTTLYYSLDLENWQTEAPAFTDVLWNGDGSVGSYQVYVLADNPDCDPAVCSYTVTIVPAA